MAENRQRVQVLLRHETHQRLQEVVPYGMRSGIFNLIANAIIDGYDREGLEFLLKLQRGEIILTTKSP